MGVVDEVFSEGGDVGDVEAEVSAEGVSRRDGAATGPTEDRLTRHTEDSRGLAGCEEGSILTPAHATTSRPGAG